MSSSIFSQLVKEKPRAFNQQKAREAYLLIQEEDEPNRTCLQYVLVDECMYGEASFLTGEKESTIKSWVGRFRSQHKELYG